MKTFLPLPLTALVLLTFPAAGQSTASAAASAPSARPAASLSADEQLFTGLIGQVSTAVEKHDMAALGKFMAPEYVHHNPNNGSGARAEELAYIGTWGQTGVKLISPVKVNRYGSTAVTVSTLVFTGRDEGKESSSTVQMMIVWVLRGGAWQMAVVQSKALPA